uniref:Uncharacterized protein n=1 Tax=Arundo donax TaxID=35708 RepID=A0A0A8YU55_ARUDO
MLTENLAELKMNKRNHPDGKIARECGTYLSRNQI